MKGSTALLLIGHCGVHTCSGTVEESGCLIKVICVRVRLVWGAVGSLAGSREAFAAEIEHEVARGMLRSGSADSSFFYG